MGRFRVVFDVPLTYSITVVANDEAGAIATAESIVRERGLDTLLRHEYRESIDVGDVFEVGTRTHRVP